MGVLTAANVAINATVADYVAVNVSSPNTPGLRNLQQANELEALLTALQQKNDELVQAHTKLFTPNRSAFM